jgi:hypothetical protein
MRANEKFSGRGHAMHLCKDCARLGKDELAYRQTIRNLERLITRDGIVPRNKREQFRRYLKHRNERVRAYAHQLAAVVEHVEQRTRQDMDELLAEEDMFPLEGDSLPDFGPEDDTDIPF